MVKKVKKKAPVKTMEELTKQFEELMKDDDQKEITKEDLEKNLKKVVKKKADS